MNNKFGSPLLNTLTGLMFLCTFSVGLTYVAILANPRLPINFFPPPTKESILVLPTTTATSVFNFPTIPPTKIAQNTAVAPTLVIGPTRTPPGGIVPTNVPTTTNTPTITPTPGVVNITSTSGATVQVTTTAFPTSTPIPTGTTAPTPTKTLSAFAYNVQDGNPLALSNAFNTKGCNWMGVVGQAFDINQTPRVSLIVHAEGGGLSIDAFTGSKPAVGPAGYEITLSEKPVQTSGTYKIQLRDISGSPLSDFVTLSTAADCNRNAILLNFVQVR